MNRGGSALVPSFVSYVVSWVCHMPLWWCCRAPSRCGSRTRWTRPHAQAVPNEDHGLHGHALGWSDLPVHLGGCSREPHRRDHDAKVYRQRNEGLLRLLVPQPNRCCQTSGGKVDSMALATAFVVSFFILDILFLLFAVLVIIITKYFKL